MDFKGFSLIDKMVYVINTIVKIAEQYVS